MPEETHQSDAPINAKHTLLNPYLPLAPRSNFCLNPVSPGLPAGLAHISGVSVSDTKPESDDGNHDGNGEFAERCGPRAPDMNTSGKNTAAASGESSSKVW